VAKSGGNKESKGGGIVGLIVVTLVALGFGAGFGFFLDGQLKNTAENKSADTDKDTKATEAPNANLPASGKIVAMAPIVANLAQPTDAWIRIEASILVDGMVQGSDALAAQLAEDILAYLRTSALSQFEGPSGFQNLREDLMDRATIRDRDHIKDIIIHGVVVE
jgi:flagellar FliL protein